MSGRRPAAAASPAAPAAAAQRRAARTPFALLVGGLVLGGMCALLALNTASAANELQRHDLAVKDADISAQVQQLRNEVQASQAPGNLAAAAAALGMVPAGNPAFLKIEPDGTVRVLGVPVPASEPVLPVPPAPVPPVAPKPAPTKKKATPAKPTTTGKQTKPGAPTTPSPSATPTHTPTPTTTLPGGTR